MKTNPNDPAFVNLCQLGSIDENGIGSASLPPLTKREYFAAMAMQGFCADPLKFKIALQKAAKAGHANEEIFTCRAAVEYADALIEALNKVTK